MTDGRHQLVGLVSLGGLYENMKLIETGDINVLLLHPMRIGNMITEANTSPYHN